MSEASGSFDLIADALKGTGAPVRRKQRPSQLFTSPATPSPAVAQPPPRKQKKKEVDRSRDHAAYVAPHRPVRAHAHSRPDDVATQRAVRPRVARAPVTRARSRWAIPVMVIGFLLTTALGFGAVMFLR